MHVMFHELEIERIYASTQTLHHFLHFSASSCSTPLYEALCSLRGVGSLDQVLRHSSPPEKDYLYCPVAYMKSHRIPVLRLSLALRGCLKSPDSVIFHR